ncbi:MAG: radical SAM protein [Syntrophobacter sp.]
MRVLLTRPQRTLLNYRVPDLGLGYLATGLRNSGHVPVLHVPDKKGWKAERALEAIRSGSIEVVGMKVMTADLGACRQLHGAVLQEFPHIPVVLGGPHVCGAKESVFNQFSGLEYAFLGEADRSFPKFVTLLRSHAGRPPAEMLRTIPGLMWRDSSTIRSNTPEVIENLDLLGWPAWDLLDPESMHIPFNLFYSKRHPIVGISTARGCTSHCTFCAIHLIEGRRYRARSAEHVLDEMELLVRKHGVREIQLLDSNCIQDKTRMISICKGIIDRKLEIAWSCPNGIKAGSVDEELAKWMGRSGCHFVFLGIESGSPRIQKLIRKGLNLAHLPEKIAILKRNGINVGGFFMFGFPGETRDDISRTEELALSLDIDVAAFSVLVPLPGSDIFTKMHPDVASRFTDCVFQNAVNHLAKVPPQELHAIAARTFIRLSLKPSRALFFFKNLNSLHKWVHLGGSFGRHLRNILRAQAPHWTKKSNP